MYDANWYVVQVSGTTMFIVEQMFVIKIALNNIKYVALIIPPGIFHTPACQSIFEKK